MMRAAIVIVAAAALVLAGCGGKSATSQATQTKSVQTKRQPQQARQAYAAALVEAAKTTNREGEQAMKELKAKKPNAVADLKASVARFHDRLAAITPPSDVASEHASLVKAAEQLTEQFDAAVDKQKQKTYASIKPLTNLSRYPAGKKIVRLTGSINAKGYNFG
jgi:exonuclease VII large subunit